MIKEKSERSHTKKVIDLQGTQGNALALIGIAKDLHKQLKNIIDLPDFKIIQSEMMSSNYDNLIKIFDKYFGNFVDIQK
jgi:hypothetical protein